MINNENNMTFQPGDEVLHHRHGQGIIEYPKQETAIVRFEHGLEECEFSVLQKQVSLKSAIQQDKWHRQIEVLAKCQSASIQSLNDTWGVFSRSRIALLPHQLWVCNKVLRRWPIRYLVADDVGLGKTIEAGLILWPLLSKGLVRRLLVLCPASLVEQWQIRLREMFDIRLTRYSTEADTKRSDFWNSHAQVVASVPTLRADVNGRHERMLEAEPWDLVIVDEAHHLNSDEKGGPTLGYKLLDSLLENNKVDSCIFFTGTPHRGKPFGFWSLMQLLRPDLFDPTKKDHDQIKYLSEVLIRNNKSLVTDMQGNKLFKPVTVYPETYGYTPEEDKFYSLLTSFISSGKAYATSLSAQEGKQVMLVLISMQKLASSSVAAIRKALQGRVKRLNIAKKDMQEHIKLSTEENNAVKMASDEAYSVSDEQQTVDVTLAKATLMLMEEEIPHLQSLVNAAEAVEEETKIDKILEILDEKFKARQVLFFTEYKATQASLMQALMKKYGEKCVTFINGDERLDDLKLPDGNIVNRSVKREDAADYFNQGKVQFLVSTEAGGEGIDLQDKCYSMIHVDLPWNPMRLHQRVGRINRYGQKMPVEVITLRNPNTVEARIWDLLNSKLEKIMGAIGSAMDDPEDLLQLVLGMSSSTLFSELFSEGQFVKKKGLDDWFNAKTNTFGGSSAIDTVKSLVGNANHFDLRGLKEIPNVDLPDLRTFFESMLTIYQRRAVREGKKLSFLTPDKWRDNPGIRPRYEDLEFNRDIKGRSAAEKVIGVGHKVFDKAMQMAIELPVSITYCNDIDSTLLMFQVFDRVTDQSGHMRQMLVGVACKNISHENMWIVLRDWQVLEKLNSIKPKELDVGDEKIPQKLLPQLIEKTKLLISSKIDSFDFPFKYPELKPLVIIMKESDLTCKA